MNFNILPSSVFQTRTWSGGTTTELFIFPQNSNYQENNFQFRLSTAKVEAEKSDFTSLPGVSRKLMVLSGSTTLIHEGHHSKQLNPFDVDSFEGDWKTTSKGKCTDFNLMTTRSTNGILRGMEIKKEESLHYEIIPTCSWFFIYVIAGGLSFLYKSQASTLQKGDLLVLEQPTITNIEIHGLENSGLVIVEIINKPTSP